MCSEDDYVKKHLVVISTNSFFSQYYHWFSKTVFILKVWAHLKPLSIFKVLKSQRLRGSLVDVTNSL